MMPIMYLRRIITSDEYSHFELAEHLTGEHHHHLICTSCGAVADVTVPHELEELLERASHAVAREQQWAVDHDHIVRSATRDQLWDSSLVAASDSILARALQEMTP